MGNNSSHHQSKGNKAQFHIISDSINIDRKLYEREILLVALKADIRKAIDEQNVACINALISESEGHIADVYQLKIFKLSQSQLGRWSLIMNHLNEYLATLKSVKEHPQEPLYVNSISPDIVNDINQKESTDNSEIFIELLRCVENELSVLKDKANRPTIDSKELYNIHKGVYYLEEQLDSMSTSQYHTINEKKFELLKHLIEFRKVIDEKSGVVEEQQQLISAVTSLEIQMDSAANSKQFQDISLSATKLYETISNNQGEFGGKKLEILRKLTGIIEKCSKPTETSDSFPIYAQVHVKDALKSIQLIDRVLEEEEHKVTNTQYENIEDLDEHYVNTQERIVIPRVQSITRNIAQRGTVYANVDVVRPSLIEENQRPKPVNKPPLPAPRNYNEKVITDLPKNWQRLNELFNKDTITEIERFELDQIRNHAEVAKSMFERKIRAIMDKCQENIDL